MPLTLGYALVWGAVEERARLVGNTPLWDRSAAGSPEEHDVGMVGGGAAQRGARDDGGIFLASTVQLGEPAFVEINQSRSKT